MDYFRLENLEYDIDKISSEQNKANRFLTKRNNELEFRVRELEYICKYLLNQIKESDYESFFELKKTLLHNSKIDINWIEPLLYCNRIECYEFYLGDYPEETQKVYCHPLKKIKIVSDKQKINYIKDIINISAVSYFNFFNMISGESLDSEKPEYLLKYKYNEHVSNIFISPNATELLVTYDEQNICRNKIFNQNECMNYLKKLFN
jgi:hypothetical protein